MIGLGVRFILGWLAPVTKIFSVGKTAVIGVAAAALAIFVRGRIAEQAEKKEANQFAQAVVENHAVEIQESAATTDEEADAALDAAAQSDRH